LFVSLVDGDAVHESPFVSRRTASQFAGGASIQLLVAVVRSGWAVRVDEAIYSTLILLVGVERAGTSAARPRVVRRLDRAGELEPA
jgi:hypothetical protein